MPLVGEVRFTARLESVDGVAIVRLPDQASAALPSRGQVAVHAELNGHPCDLVLEPDGRKGHWVRVGPELQQTAGAAPDDPVVVALRPSPVWPEPDVPTDLASALRAADAQVQDLWQSITPMARWEWVRWVNATASPGTRQRRVEVSVSKLGSGKRRPCCFDLSACTDPEVSRSGKLRASGSST